MYFLDKKGDIKKEYNREELEMLSEGMFVSTGITTLSPTSAPNGGKTYQQEYVLRDQQGNSRVVFCDDDNDGIVEENEIKEKAHYYSLAHHVNAR